MSTSSANGNEEGAVAYIDAEHKALIYQMRCDGHSWSEVLDEVVKTDGTPPSKAACQKVMKRWNKKKGDGRTGAPRKTTPKEDRLIVRLVEKYRFKQYVSAHFIHTRGSVFAWLLSCFTIRSAKECGLGLCVCARCVYVCVRACSHHELRMATSSSHGCTCAGACE